MSTQKRVLVPASPENILQSHVGVIVIILCGMAGLLGTLGICMYGYVKFRRARRAKLEKDLGNEIKKGSIIHLTRVKTDGTSRSKSSEDTLPKRPRSFGNDYGVVGFGNCRTSFMESITGSYGGILPGDIDLPENGASTARNIRDTSAILTPPKTPDKCKISAIQHWNQAAEEYSGPPEPLMMRDTALLEVAIPPPLAINGDGKELPNLPMSRGRLQRAGEVDPPLFGAVKRASMRRRARSKNQAWDTPGSWSCQVSSLRRFGELEARRGNNRARKERYLKRISTDSKLVEGLPFSESPSYETVKPRSGSAGEAIDAHKSNLETEGYRESIISAYDKDSTDDTSEYIGEDTYLWKPLPRPPMEGGWLFGEAKMLDQPSGNILAI
ncbi:hypothetical protein TWF730_010140 [Orbilia blumenaviensis]|uniref:Uncharacterized protein n=1 Tax=Orbilia blumenaviensis TaxID=1796055 RepID=A0AAV9URA5_9PEZI